VIGQSADWFIQLPWIDASWCNDEPDESGAYGKHTHISWRTTGCSCCSTEVYNEPITPQNLADAVRKLHAMKVAIDDKIAELERWL